MTAKDVYAGILRELDRYQSPSFEPHEYNYFLPKAVDQVLLEAYRDYKATGNSSDVLRFYSKTVEKTVNEKLSGRLSETALEADDRYLLSAFGYFRALMDHCGNKAGDPWSFYLNETEEGRIRDLVRNHYLQPRIRENRAYWLIEGRNLKVFHAIGLHTSLFQVHKVSYVSVKDPVLTDFLLPANFQTATLPQIDVPQKLIRLFINKTVAMFLENTANPRISTHPTINN